MRSLGIDSSLLRKGCKIVTINWDLRNPTNHAITATNFNDSVGRTLVDALPDVSITILSYGLFFVLQVDDLTMISL
jgi:hypothetical protein